MNLITPKTCKI